MATKKKAAAKAKRVFVLHDGSRYDVVSETGKYIVCENGIQFRKSANRGEIVEEANPNNGEKLEAKE